MKHLQQSSLALCTLGLVLACFCPAQAEGQTAYGHGAFSERVSHFKSNLFGGANCGRAISNADAEALWSDYCYEDCTLNGDCGHGGCGRGACGRGACGRGACGQDACGAGACGRGHLGGGGLGGRLGCGHHFAGRGGHGCGTDFANCDQGCDQGVGQVASGLFSHHFAGRREGCHGGGIGRGGCFGGGNDCQNNCFGWPTACDCGSGGLGHHFAGRGKCGGGLFDSHSNGGGCRLRHQHFASDCGCESSDAGGCVSRVLGNLHGCGHRCRLFNRGASNFDACSPINSCVGNSITASCGCDGQ